MGAFDWFFGGDATKRLGETKGDHGEQVGGYLSSRLNQGKENRQMFDPAMQNMSRQQQMQQMQQMNAVARGRAQGAGEIATNRQIGQAQAAQQSMAQQARGANMAAMAKQGAQNQADLRVGGVGMAQQARTQDQMAANQQLAGLMSGIRGQDQAQQEAYVRQQGMNDQLTQNYLRQLMQLNQNDYNNRLAKAGFKKTDTGHFADVMQAGGMILGGIVGGPGGAMAGGEMGKGTGNAISGSM